MPIEKRGRGRPRKDNIFTEWISFRGTIEHERMLSELEKCTGKSRSEILREALEKYYYLKVMGQMTYFD